MAKVKLREGHCPKCNGPLEYNSSEPQGSMYVYRVHCKCGWGGDEYYELQFAGFEDDAGNHWDIERSVDTVNTIKEVK